MGNRAVITANQDLNGVGIYLHWNGGRDSVEAFLCYCKMKGYRAPDRDCYGWAYLAGVITNTFADGLSCGIDLAANLDCDNYDNGVYIIRDWLIVGRIYRRGSEQLQYDLRKMVTSIDEAQPKEMRLSETEWESFDQIKKQIIEHRKKSPDIKLKN